MDKQQSIANIVIIISSYASMLATLSVIIKFLFNKGLWNVLKQSYVQFEFFLIFALCLNDFMQASTVGIPLSYYWSTDQLPFQYPEQYSSSTSCRIQAFLQLYSCLGQFTWTFNIAYSVNKGIYYESDQRRRKRIMILCLFGFITPLILSLIPLFWHQFGQTGLCLTGCFIQSNDLTGYLLTIFIFAIPMITIFVINYHYFKNTMDQLNNARNSLFQNHKRLLIYPLILLISQGWFTFYFIISIFKDIQWNNYQIWCYLMSNLLGLFDAIAYGCNKQDRKQSLDTVIDSNLNQNVNSSQTIELQLSKMI